MRTLAALSLILPVLGQAAGPVAAQDAPPNAEPGRTLVVLEASMDRSVFQTSGSDGEFSLQVTNSNPWADPDAGLLPGDRMLLLIPEACGILAPDCEVLLDAAELSVDELSCSVFPGGLEIRYEGAPAPLRFGESYGVRAMLETPLPTSRVGELGFLARAEPLGRWRPHGVHRIANPGTRARPARSGPSALPGGAGTAGAARSSST